MKNLLTLFTLALLPVAAFAQEQATSQQAIPRASAVRVQLRGPSIVQAGAAVNLVLSIQVEQDTEVPAQLLTGAALAVRVGGELAREIKQPGKGGAVPLSKGTRIERELSFPVAALIGNPGIDEVTLVAVGWQGIAGADCSFKVAPDTKNVKLDELDLTKTQVILVTNYGDMTLSFRPDKAPNHVRNFVKLCLQGFYDGTKFHRVIRNFMIQGGCPYTKDDSKKELWGTGGPGYTIDAEFNDLRHLKGTLSMARTSDPNSAGSGFFIVHRDSPHLDNQYTAFGNLVSGIDVLDAIANVPVGGPQRSTPHTPVVLEAAVVLPVKKQ